MYNPRKALPQQREGLSLRGPASCEFCSMVMIQGFSGGWLGVRFAGQS